MPFLTRNPSHYLPSLAERTVDPLHVGLDLAAAPQDAVAAEDEWAALASALRATARPVRCLWIRAERSDGGDEGGGTDDVVPTALRPLGAGLVGAKHVESLVLEGLTADALACLRGYLSTTKTLRGIKFLRTGLDARSSSLLSEFFEGDPSLRVVDLTSNPRVDDAVVRGVLGGILRNGRCRLETLNILEADAGGRIGITEAGVKCISSFASQTPSLSTLRLSIRDLSDASLGELAHVLTREGCKITRLEIGGRFGDDGMRSIADALTTNISLRTIDISMAARLTDSGLMHLLQVVRGQDDSWKSKTTSNHTLQHVYISETTGSSLNKDLVTELQSITTLDPIPTLQTKAWEYIDANLEDVSALGVAVNLTPRLLSFVSTRGGADALYRFLHSRTNLNSGLLSNPTPERARLIPHMERIKRENAVLRAMLLSERDVGRAVRRENVHLRDGLEEEEDDEDPKKAMTRCLLLPLFKACEVCQSLVEMMKERPEEHVH